MNEKIKTDISGKWVPINEVHAIIEECISIAQAGLAPQVATVIKERFGLDHE
jgi:hypothetical protein